MSQWQDTLTAIRHRNGFHTTRQTTWSTLFKYLVPSPAVSIVSLYTHYINHTSKTTVCQIRITTAEVPSSKMPLKYHAYMHNSTNNALGDGRIYGPLPQLQVSQKVLKTHQMCISFHHSGLLHKNSFIESTCICSPHKS